MELFHTQTHGGFVKEFVGDGPGTGDGAELRGDDVGMAEGFLNVGGGWSTVVADIDATKPVVETVAPDGVPELVHAVAVEGEELLHGGDAFFIEAGFCAGTYTG